MLVSTVYVEHVNSLSTDPTVRPLENTSRMGVRIVQLLEYITQNANGALQVKQQRTLSPLK